MTVYHVIINEVAPYHWIFETYHQAKKFIYLVNQHYKSLGYAIPYSYYWAQEHGTAKNDEWIPVEANGKETFKETFFSCDDDEDDEWDWAE